jgi:hypothetical protein
MKYIEEELTMAEFMERFVNSNDFDTPEDYDISSLGIEILTEDKNGNEVYKPLTNFIVKENVDRFWTDGLLKGTCEHSIICDGEQIKLKDHPDFYCVNEPMKVVDITVEDEHTYLANGRLNHNTTSGGHALKFHASVRLRLKAAGQIKAKVNDVEQVIGIKTICQVIKNRCGPPLRKTEFDIYFTSGIDDTGGWLNVLKTYKLVTQGGAWYTLIDQKGVPHKFQSKDFENLILADEELHDYVYGKICDALITSYNKSQMGIYDVIIDEKEPIPEG